MITVCATTFGGGENHLPYLINSVLDGCKMVDEIIVCKVEAEADYKEETIQRNVQIKMVGYPVIAPSLIESSDATFFNPHKIGHPVCVQHAIDLAKNDFVLVTDPDVFFYEDIDKIYFDLFERHNLDIIGVSHQLGPNNCQTFFPNILNFMVKKSTLPGSDWMIGEEIYMGHCLSPVAPINGRVFHPGLMPKFIDQYPNPAGITDTSCNLWLWCNQRQGRWLAFQTSDCHLYTTQYCRGNFKPLPMLKKQKLMWHGNGGSWLRNFEMFQKEYQEKEKDQEE